MKIKVTEKTYEEVMAIPTPKHVKPVKQSAFFRHLIKWLSASELKKANFTHKSINMEQIGDLEPCFYLMNHSSFIDLKIAASLIYPKPFHIVCTSDGFVGKEWLMRKIGCIPARKFITDVALVKDMFFAVKSLKSSVLMYPEASYTFDGTATPLPEGIGKCVKLLDVPVVMIKTQGAFLRDPLYNGLQIRKVDVSASMECILTREQIKELSEEEITELIRKSFVFDQFKYQQENNIRVDEPFRADGLNRVLYKCPACESEGQMKGNGDRVTCSCCGKSYVLTESGFMKAVEGETEFEHIPDWYSWERRCVRKEIMDGAYKLELPVDICMMVDMKSIYHVGEGVLKHSSEGFILNGCNGSLNYEQKPQASYSLYSDYFWYEIGDVICIGNNRALYYCFPKDCGDIVAKARLAAEELYKLKKQNVV